MSFLCLSLAVALLYLTALTSEEINVSTVSILVHESDGKKFVDLQNKIQVITVCFFTNILFFTFSFLLSNKFFTLIFFFFCSFLQRFDGLFVFFFFCWNWYKVYNKHQKKCSNFACFSNFCLPFLIFPFFFCFSK